MYYVYNFFHSSASNNRFVRWVSLSILQTQKTTREIPAFMLRNLHHRICSYEDSLFDDYWNHRNFNKLDLSSPPVFRTRSLASKSYYLIKFTSFVWFRNNSLFHDLFWYAELAKTEFDCFSADWLAANLFKLTGFDFNLAIRIINLFWKEENKIKKERISHKLRRWEEVTSGKQFYWRWPEPGVLRKKSP